jgi:hypothetical protein
MLSEDQKRRVDFEIKVALGGFMLHLAVQIMHISCPWHERWQRLLSIPVASIMWALPLTAPEFYTRHRTAFLIIFKVIFFAFPLLRKARGIQRVLDAPATPGVGGFLIDIIKMGWGSRLLAVISSGLGQPLPFVWQLIVQSYSVAMIRGNASLCSSRLMSDPLTVKRVRAFSMLSSEALLPSFCMGKLVSAGSECSFMFTLLHIIFGVLAPTLPSIKESGWLDSRYSGRLAVWWIGMSVTWAVAIMATLYL